MKYYKEMSTGKIVYEEDAEDYVLERLGITVTPRGKNGEMTTEQIENIESTVEWFFSGNWIEEEEKDEEELEDDLEYQVCRYENYHEAMWDGKIY